MILIWLLLFPEDLEYRVEFVVVIYNILIGTNHDAVVKASNHIAEDIDEETLILHLNEIRSLGLIHSTREDVDKY